MSFEFISGASRMDLQKNEPLIIQGQTTNLT